MRYLAVAVVLSGQATVPLSPSRGQALPIDTRLSISLAGQEYDLTARIYRSASSGPFPLIINHGTPPDRSKLPGANSGLCMQPFVAQGYMVVIALRLGFGSSSDRYLVIVFPQRNDSRIVGAISRAYYPVLAKAGARMFEFRGGLLHAKTLVVDDRLALIGSSNLDRRSLDLNFENNVLLESEDIARKVVEHQRRWLTVAIEIDHDVVAKRPLPRRLLDNLSTMAAPLF